MSKPPQVKKAATPLPPAQPETFTLKGLGRNHKTEKIPHNRSSTLNLFPATWYFCHCYILANFWVNYLCSVICIWNISETLKILQGKIKIKGVFECLENSLEEEEEVQKKEHRAWGSRGGNSSPLILLIREFSPSQCSFSSLNIRGKLSETKHYMSLWTPHCWESLSDSPERAKSFLRKMLLPRHKYHQLANWVEEQNLCGWVKPALFRGMESPPVPESFPASGNLQPVTSNSSFNGFNWNTALNNHLALIRFYNHMYLRPLCLTHYI